MGGRNKEYVNLGRKCLDKERGFIRIAQERCFYIYINTDTYGPAPGP